MRYSALLLFCLFFFPYTVQAFPYSLYKFDTDSKGPVTLVTAGIHGDEPAAFSAAGILVSLYKFTSGRVWVVPNLNFQSILLSSRGIAGDMNRKFLIQNKNDPDYANLEKIKNLIRDPQVDFVYSMHDGSGFYRPTFISNLYAPYRWGQCIVIDQEEIPNDIPHANTKKIAEYMVTTINKKLLAKNEAYHIHNTRTKDGNNPMEQSLTWFAVQNKKSSIGVEASKNLPLYQGVYYHLLALEAMFTYKGIRFERSFPLTEEGVKHALYAMTVKLFNTYTLPLENIRPNIRYLPFPNANVEFTSNNPIVYVYRKNTAYAVQYGNTILTTIHPEFMPFTHDMASIPIVVDKKTKNIPMGTVFNVKHSFLVPKIAGYRLNIIGYVNPKKKSEFSCFVTKKTLMPQFSLDTTEKIYRVELYKGSSFAGIVYARFL